MTNIKRLRPTKLLWVDLEMTGIGFETNRIIEVAAVITDFDFKTLATYEAPIARTAEELALMDDWNVQHHTESGLVERIQTEGITEETVRATLCSLVREHFGDEPAVLAGNSIHNDRNFIREWWPDVEALLHYRMLDVTSLKVYMQGKYDVEYAKKNTHSPVIDIQESIEEFRYYLDQLRTLS